MSVQFLLFHVALKKTWVIRYQCTDQDQTCTLLPALSLQVYTARLHYTTELPKKNERSQNVLFKQQQLFFIG